MSKSIIYKITYNHIWIKSVHIIDDPKSVHIIDGPKSVHIKDGPKSVHIKDGPKSVQEKCPQEINVKNIFKKR